METQPSTLFEALDLIINRMSEEDRAYVRRNGMAGSHHGFGMNLRNGWNLWGTQSDKPTTLRQHFMDVYGLGHADDMSGMIFHGLERMFPGDGSVESFTEEDAQKEAARYHEYWKKQGIDPLTQERVGEPSASGPLSFIGKLIKL